MKTHKVRRRHQTTRVVVQNYWLWRDHAMGWEPSLDNPAANET